MKPVIVHEGQLGDAIKTRSEVLKAPFSQYPERFSKKVPKLLIPRQEAGINIPVERQSIFVLD